MKLNRSKCVFLLSLRLDLFHPSRFGFVVDLRRKFLLTLHFINKSDKAKKELLFHPLLGGAHLICLNSVHHSTVGRWCVVRGDTLWQSITISVSDEYSVSDIFKIKRLETPSRL